jgi:tetratricopeptide (TPR) repeat protein
LNILLNTRIQAIIVFLVAIIQYSNTAQHQYVWDDAIVITENDRVQKGLDDVGDLFRNIKSNETQNRYGYRPLALLSFAIDVELFGLHPEPAHKVSILLYGLLSVLIIFFLNWLFPGKPLEILVVTLLFVVHPLHTEVVANIKSRDEILALGFGLISLMAYGTALQKGKPWLYGLSLVAMVIAFLCKESAVTLVGVAFVLPWILFNSKEFVINLKRSIPLLILLGVLLSIRVYVYSDQFFESNDFELVEKGLFFEDAYVGNPVTDAEFSVKVSTAIFLISYFIYRFAVPTPLLHDYSYNQFAIQSWDSAYVWFSMLFLFVLIRLALYGVIKRKPYGFGLILFLVSSTIYLHLVQEAPDIFAERFLFVPSLGLCIVMLSVHELNQNLGKASLTVLLLGSIVFFGYSWNRNKAWKDNRTLLETDLPELKNCVRANYNYALMLHSEYYQLSKERQVAARPEILKYYERTMQLTDRLFNVYFDLGGAYMEFGYPDKAFQVFTTASEKYPDHSLPWVQLGKYYMSFQEYAKAIPYFKRAMKLGSKNSDFNYLLAICLFNSGWYEDAIETMLEGEELGVSSSSYHALLARLYNNMLSYDEAENALKRGLILYPNDPGLNKSLIEVRSFNRPVP